MRRTPITATLMLLATVVAPSFASRPAAAADGDPPPPVAPFLDSGNTLPDLAARERAAQPPRGKWYGWQILLGDLATTGCAVAARSGLCVAPYLLSGPAVHVAHGRPGLAAASFGIRVLGPLLGAVLAGTPKNCRPASPPPAQMDDGDTVVGIPTFDSDFLCGGFGDLSLTGALVGAAIAALLDSALGFDRATLEPTPAAPARQARTIAPRLTPEPGGISLGLGAAF